MEERGGAGYRLVVLGSRGSLDQGRPAYLRLEKEHCSGQWEQPVTPALPAGGLGAQPGRDGVLPPAGDGRAAAAP